MKIQLAKIKFLILFIILVGSTAHSQKQKMKLKFDDESQLIYVNGEPYAKMIKTSADLLGLNKHFTIQNLQGEELMFMKFAPREHWDRENQQTVTTVYYDISFTQSGANASVKKGFGLREKGAMKLLMKHGLVKDHTIDPQAESKYIRANNGSYPKKQFVDKNAKSDSQIILNGDQITQNGNIFGKFIVKKITSSSSEERTLITIYSNAGEKIAKIEAPVVNASEWAMTTSSDGKTTEFLFKSVEETEDLFKWLINKNYLTI
jgi:hypothetical protein